MDNDSGDDETDELRQTKQTTAETLQIQLLAQQIIKQRIKAHRTWARQWHVARNGHGAIALPKCLQLM